MTHPLDVQAKQLARSYKKLEGELLEVIIKIDKQKLFYQLGYNSLFTYATGALKLSPAQAYGFISVARKSREVPALKKEIVSGKLSLSKAQKMTSVLTQKNHEHWLKLAQKNTHRELEKQVALASPKYSVQEKAKYVHPDEPIPEQVRVKKEEARVELKLGVSESLMLKLRRAQDVMSQNRGQHQDLEQSLEALVDLYLKSKDPLEKAKRQEARGKLNLMDSLHEESMLEKNQTLEGGQWERHRDRKNNLVQARRKPLPAKVKQQVYWRDQGQCTHRDHRGHRCTSRRFLEIHHIQPVSQGGKNELDNLTLLCSGHHKARHLATGYKNPVCVASVL